MLFQLSDQSNTEINNSTNLMKSSRLIKSSISGVSMQYASLHKEPNSDVKPKATS